jgi:hypothetical protein
MSDSDDDLGGTWRMGTIGCEAGVYLPIKGRGGRDLRVYKKEHSSTKWGGEKVEGYIVSTPGSRFVVDMVNWRERDDFEGHYIVGDVVLDKTCMGQFLVSRLILSFLTPMRSRASRRLRENKYKRGRIQYYHPLK